MPATTTPAEPHLSRVSLERPLEGPCLTFDLARELAQLQVPDPELFPDRMRPREEGFPRLCIVGADSAVDPEGGGNEGAAERDVGHQEERQQPADLRPAGRDQREVPVRKGAFQGTGPAAQMEERSRGTGAGRCAPRAASAPAPRRATRRGPSPACARAPAPSAAFRPQGPRARRSRAGAPRLREPACPSGSSRAPFRGRRGAAAVASRRRPE